MSKYLLILRNNWKKSVFGCLALSYAAHYSINKYHERKLMEKYCREALEIGQQPLASGQQPRIITVILNPAANKNKAKSNYEKYSAPLLHLSGIAVNLVQTKFEGHAIQCAEEYDFTTEALIVAGGDGTLSETVTGLLRRSDSNQYLEQKFPIGIIPLGKFNSFAERIFNGFFQNQVELIGNATMAIIKNNIKPCDVIKINVLEENNNNEDDVEVKINVLEENNNKEDVVEVTKPELKPVFCLSGIEWGVFRDANTRADKYWYWGNLNRHISYIFTGLKSLPDICWDCMVDIQYTLPCSGCSKCFETITYPKNQILYKSWLPFFSSKPKDNSNNDKIKSRHNEECGKYLQKKISTSNLSLKLANNEEKSCIKIDIARNNIGYFDYVNEGWERLKGKENYIIDTIEAQNVQLHPSIKQTNDNSKYWISIDNEAYELKPLELMLLPKKIHIFYKTS